MIDSISLRAVIPAELAGERLDRAAAVLWDDFSRSRIQQWIESGELTVDGAISQAKVRVKGGETVAIEATIEAETEAQAEPIPLTIVYEDDGLIVVDKPAGLVVHPGAGNRSGTLMNALLDYDPALRQVPRAGLVHRLDKDTTGLLVIARDISVQQKLAAMIEQRQVKRVYRAVCQTVLTGGGLIDAAIDRHPRDRTRMAIRDGGREARTHYRVVERFRAHTHVELELDTGRTHQIRVHMAHIRAPLVGDPVYGGRPRLPPAPGETLRKQLQQFGRQALHAASLSLVHPVSAEPLQLDSALPADFEALLGALRRDLAEASA